MSLSDKLLICFVALGLLSGAYGGDWPFSPTLNTQTFPGSSDLKTGGTDVIAIGIHNNGSSGAIRSFTQFDLSSMPSTAIVSSVEFKIQTSSGVGTLPPTMKLVSLGTTNSISTSVSWTKINGSSNWTNGGGDVAQILASVTPVWSNLATYVFWSSNEFVDAVQDAISNRAGVFQCLLYAPEHEAAYAMPSTAGGFIRMYARNTAFAAVLTVTADVSPPGPPPGEAYPWSGVDYNSAEVQTDFTIGGTVSGGSISTLITNVFDDGNSITSILTATSANMQVRVRNNVGNTSSNYLFKDLVFSSGGDLTLTFKGLQSRAHQFTAWFNDSMNASSILGDYEAVMGVETVDTWQATGTADAGTGIAQCEFLFNASKGQ